MRLFGTGRVFVGAALVLAVVAGCGSSSPPAGTPPADAVVVTSVNSEFVPGSVAAPAGEAFALYFDNRDTVPHNTRVVDTAGATIVAGELFTGPSARVTQVPALAAGTYRILCDIHPDMVGELVAAP